MRAVAALIVALVGGCSDPAEVPGHAALVRQVERHPVGNGRDHWIERVAADGSWERVGLVFGYVDDYAECLHAIEGLERYSDRGFRCVPAN